MHLQGDLQFFTGGSRHVCNFTHGSLGLQPRGPFCDNLTNFGTTTFTDAYAMDNSTFGSINAFPNTADDLYTNTYCAEVGGLGNGGTQFTDWWIHS